MRADHELERILVITAHPDDVDFGAAGSVARWADGGITVTYCIVIDGEAGGSDVTMARAAMAELRRAEQTAAAKVVGVTDLTFLSYPDGRVVPSLELRRDLTREIRIRRPDRVLCPAAERVYARIYASHPDHLATGEASIAAVYPDSRNPFAHPELLEEGLEPWVVPEVLVMGSPTNDAFVDITDTIERKVEALLCHASQIDDPAALGERMRSWGRSMAATSGLEAGRYAEGYLYVNTP